MTRPGPRRFGFAAALFFSVILLGGCGGGGTRFSGEVTLDGQPVDGGTIVLYAAGGADETRKNVSGNIVEGKFALEPGGTLLSGALSPGPYRVEIYWHKK